MPLTHLKIGLTLCSGTR